MSSESTGQIPTARSLYAQMRWWRRGRATMSVGEIVTEVYAAVLSAAILISMVVSAVIRVGDHAGSACVANTPCAQQRTAVPWLVLLASLVGLIMIARLLGPIFTTPAVRSWLLTTPVDRTQLLRPRLFLVLAATAAAGAVVGGLVVTLAGFGAAPILAVVVGTSAAAALLVASTALSQERDGRSIALISWVLAAIVWVGFAALALGLTPGWSAPTRVPVAGWVVLLVLTGAAGFASVRAHAGLRLLKARDLSANGSILPALSGALATVDLAMVYDVLVAHRWSSRPPVHSRRLGGRGPFALVVTDLHRLWRSPGTACVPLAVGVFWYALSAMNPGPVIVLVGVLVSFWTLLPLLVGLRVISRTPGLQRMLPQPKLVTRCALLVVPCLVALAVGLGVSPAIMRAADLDGTVALTIGLAAGLSCLAAAARWVTGAPPNYARPLISTPAGGVPTNLYGSAFRGLDIVMLCTAPILFAPTTVGAAISAGAALAVLGFVVAN